MLVENEREYDDDSWIHEAEYENNNQECEDEEIDFTLGFTEQEQIEIEKKHNIR